MTKRTAYTPAENHAERLAYAVQAIARIERTMLTGDNRFGTYGQNCRDSIARWRIVADHARGRIELGEA